MGAPYKNYKSADIKNQDAGYSSNAFITPMSHLSAVAAPVISSTELLGERETIATNHTYASGKKSIAVYMAPKEAEADGEVVGVSLAHSLKYTPKIILRGDGPEILGLVKKLMRDSFLLHFEDFKKCENGGGFVQFGSYCNPCTVIGGSFKSGKGGDGAKYYELQLEAFDKYFYTGVIEEQA